MREDEEPLIRLADQPDSIPEDDVDDELLSSTTDNHLPSRKQNTIFHSVRYAFDVVRDHLRAWKNIYICGWLIVGLEIPLFMAAAPGIQLIEDAVCRQIYGRTFSHDMCQGKDVQTKIAEIKGVLGILSAIPSLVFAVPYGILADRKGRKFVVGLTVGASFGCYLWSFAIFYFYNTLPFGLIYTYPLILWIGGGGFVASSIITAIASEVAPSPEARTRAFFFLAVIGRLVAVAAPPIGARIMHFYGEYFAYFLSIPLSLMPAIPLYLLPETAKAKDASEDDEGDALNSMKGAGDWRARIHEMKIYVRKDLLPMLKSLSVLIGMFSMVVSSFSLAIGDFIMQYMKARFGWDYEKATHIIALSAGLQILFLCTVLPLLHKQLTDRFESRKADLIMSKFSIFFDFISPLVFGLSNEPAGAWFAVAIGCFGIGFGGAMRAYMTTLVPEQDVAVLYTLFGTAAAVGGLIASPLLQFTLAVGIRAGGMAVGLPFFVIAGMYGVNTILVWALRLRPAQIPAEEDEEDEPPLEGAVRI